jgi:ribulose-phosphate 3-epimerase
MIKLAPSILSADFGRLADQLLEAEQAGAHLIHVDVMDGHFVPNITIGPAVVKAVDKYTSLPLDVHLMIDSPEKYIDDFIEAGADLLTLHQEATPHAHRLIQRIKKAGVKAGLAINPGTATRVLEDIVHDLDLVTVMSVNPGFGGQTFIHKALKKVSALRRLINEQGLTTEIEVDGGVTLDNAATVIEAGADILVAGSAVFGQPDIRAAVDRFLAIMAGARNGAAPKLAP